MDRVSRIPVNEPGGRRGSGEGVELALLYRFDFGDMKGGMNSHGARTAETDCSRANDLSDGERAHKPWGQLPRLYHEWEVMCGQPNLLTRSVAGCRDPTAVGIPLVPVG